MAQIYQLSLNTVDRLFRTVQPELHLTYSLRPGEENNQFDEMQKLLPYIKKLKEQDVRIVSHFSNPYLNDINLDYSKAELQYDSHYPACSVSIIIPTFNRSNLINQTLKSLEQQDCQRTFEVIVVDDGGYDNTLSKIKSYNYHLNLRFIYWPRDKPYIFGEPGNRAGPARNLGASYAIGDWLFFLDSDVVVEKNFISNHLENHDEHTVVFGIRINKMPGSYEEYYDIKTRELLQKAEQHNHSIYEKIHNFFMSHNLSLTKKNFDSTGGFSSDFVFHGYEDQEWLYRAMKIGLKPKLDKNIIVHHQYHEPEYINGVTARNINKISRLIFFAKHFEDFA